MKHDLLETITRILSRCMDMTVATVRPDGAPQATVVSYAHDGLTIYFGCGADSQKARNIAHESRVSLTMTEPYADWLKIKGLSIAATATEVTSPGEMTAVGKLMFARFPEVATIPHEEVGAAKLFRLRPTIVSILDYSKGFGHTETVTIGADDIAESSGTMRHHWVVAA